MAFDHMTDAVIVGAINSVLWLLIGARIVERRRQLRQRQEPVDSVTAPRADFVLIFVSVSLALYYVVYVTWMIRPSLAGPYLFDPNVVTASIGIVLAVVTLGLVAWAYRVFGSWRLLARIDDGHELITDGPFTLVRHPIYTGIVGAYVSTLLVVPTVGFVVAVVVIAAAHDIRAREEERLLATVFGDRYVRYMGSTKRFLPAVY